MPVSNLYQIVLPISYYSNNVSSTISLLNVMSEFDCNRLIFSSSATVYDQGSIPPFRENSRLSAVSPYGNTKLQCEQIIENWSQSLSRGSAYILRYFNPIGSNPDVDIGENFGPSSGNIVPNILNAITNNAVCVYGDDYDTDGLLNALYTFLI